MKYHGGMRNAIYTHNGKPFLFVDTVFFYKEEEGANIIECDKILSAKELLPSFKEENSCQKNG